MRTQTAIELHALDQHEPAPKPLLPEHPSTGGKTIGSSPPTSTHEPETPTPKLSKSRSWIVIIQLCSINLVSSFNAGYLTICLPTIAPTLVLSGNLLLWPNSVSFLTGGSCLLIAGSVADVLGPRKMNLIGSLFTGVFILASGLARDGIELILFRAIQGIATALFVPTAVSILSTNIEHGRPRNIGFTTFFLAYPLGYGVGLVLGGVFINAAGWRVGFLAAGATEFLFFLVGFWTLPKDAKLGSMKEIAKKLATEIDWIGAVIASACLSTLSYVLA